MATATNRIIRLATLDHKGALVHEKHFLPEEIDRARQVARDEHASHDRSMGHQAKYMSCPPEESPLHETRRLHWVDAPGLMVANMRRAW